MRNEILKYFIILFFFSCSKEIPVPGNAILIFPINNEVCEKGTIISQNESEINFRWNESTDTNFYELIINDLNNSEILRFKDLTSTSKKVKLSRGVPYSWKIISASDSEFFGSSNLWKFYLSKEGNQNYPPFPAIIKSPYSGEIVTLNSDNKLTLSWEGNDPNNDDLLYTVYIDTVDGKQSPISSLTDITANTIEIELQKSTIYYWRIKTSDKTNSSFTTVYSFKTK
jgi:hypothetical protein